MYAFRKNPMTFLQRLASTHGDIAKFQMGPINAILLNNPELIHEVLVKNSGSFPKLGRQTKTIRLIDGNSLFVKQGKDWLNDRRLLKAGFTPARIKQCATDIVKITTDRISKWPDGQTLNVCDEATELAIQLAGKTILGVDLSTQSKSLLQTVNDRSEIFVREMGALVRTPDHYPLPWKRKKRELIKTMDNVIYSAMREKRKSADSNVSGNGDILSLLLSAGIKTGISDEQIRDHINMIFQSGVDDIATALIWMNYLVARHPGVQQKIKQETSAALTNGPALNPASLNFTRQVVKETLRLYPSTWLFTARCANCDTTIGGWPVKRRTWVFISPYVTQRDSRFFEAPTQFNPNRFAAERITKAKEAAYFPFGMGARTCPAARFATMELTLVAATLLQNFSLTLEPGQKQVTPVPKVTVRPAQPIKIRVVRNRGLELARAS